MMFGGSFCLRPFWNFRRAIHGKVTRTVFVFLAPVSSFVEFSFLLLVLFFLLFVVVLFFFVFVFVVSTVVLGVF